MASPVDTSVKYFYSAMSGSPALTDAAGSLLAVLDAVLINGFGAKAVTTATISSGVCRLNFDLGPSCARIDSVILVAGATPAGLNGEQKVTDATLNYVEFKTDLPNSTVSSPVTGAVSFKMAPLGWSKVYSKTNVAVYRANDPKSARPFLRVTDSSALFARVQMYENMTTVDAGTGVAPALSGGYYWHRSDTTDNTARYWLIVGDSRGFYFANGIYLSTAESPNGYALLSRYFGDLNSYKSGDAWRGTLTGSTDSTPYSTYGCPFQPSTGGYTLARSSVGTGSRILSSRQVFGNSSMPSGGDGTLGTYPARSDTGLHLGKILLSDGDDSMTFGPRGEFPGAYHCPQSGVSAVLGGDLLLTKGTGIFAGKTLLSIPVGGPSGSATGSGTAFFNITDPWRL